MGPQFDPSSGRWYHLDAATGRWYYVEETTGQSRWAPPRVDLALSRRTAAQPAPPRFRPTEYSPDQPGQVPMQTREPGRRRPRRLVMLGGAGLVLTLFAIATNSDDSKVAVQTAPAGAASSPASSSPVSSSPVSSSPASSSPASPSPAVTPRPSPTASPGATPGVKVTPRPTAAPLAAVPTSAAKTRTQPRTTTRSTRSTSATTAKTTAAQPRTTTRPRTTSTTVAAPKTRTTAPTSSKETSNCVIKGNIASDGERIYHVPGQQYYNVTKIDIGKGERWFCTESAARAAGWRKAKV